MNAMIHPTKFAAAVIEMGKDFDPEWIIEMIVSRVSPANFPAIIDELSEHISGNEMNGARYATEAMEGL